jgi:hypothetical protein
MIGMRLLPVVLTPLLLLAVATTAEIPQDPWFLLSSLAGRWTGEGNGFGSMSDVTHDWEFVLQHHFLRLQTQSVARGGDGPGEVHEDVGFLSLDTDRPAFVFRQFLSEGFVNTFEVDIQPGEKPVLLFQFRESESSGGMRVQMRLVFESADEYVMTMDLAAPGRGFSTCQSMRMKRVE